MHLSGKKIILAVTNDMSGDQRVDRIATTLIEAGARVEVVGRQCSFSRPLPSSLYRVHRLQLSFERGKLFYLSYNWQLTRFLIKQKADLICANDLDTLLGCWLAARNLKIPLVYDSHEYFTEVPELVGRPLTRAIWLKLEQWLFPTLQQAYTVNEPIAEIYRQKYRVPVGVIRNLPRRRETRPKTKPSRILIYQGALNVGRGIELMIAAMTHLPEYRLWIIGRGDIETDLKARSEAAGLQERIVFHGFVPPAALPDLTRQAGLGFSLEADLGANYRLASPNKVYDYIQDGIPVLVSDLPVMSKLVEDYRVGEVLPASERSPQKLAQRIRSICEQPALWSSYQENSLSAARNLCWEKEQERLLSIYGKAFEQTENRTFDS